MADYDSALPIRTGLFDGDIVAATTTDMFLAGGTDGVNYQVLAVDSSGNLQVDVLSGGGGASSVDDSAFGIGTDDVAPMGALADDTAPDSVDEGDVGLVRMGLNRILYNQPFDGTNKQPMLDANTRAGFMQITDGTNDVDVAVDGATEGTTGIMAMGSDGTNAQFLSTTSAGVLNVNVGGNVSNSNNYATANLVKDTPTTTATLTGAAVVRKIVASGSGLMKVEVKFGTTLSEVVIAVFYNSTANPNIEYEWPGGLAVSGSQTILLSCTNLESAASPTSDFDGHGTIMTEV